MHTRLDNITYYNMVKLHFIFIGFTNVMLEMIYIGKDWLAQNPDNVSEWGDMSICGLLFQSASAITIKLRMLV
jgi:hypothetical protein